MDEAGFRSWLDGRGLATHTCRDAVSCCRRVEAELGLDLDTVSDAEHVRPQLWDLKIDSPRPKTVVATLMWAMRKYVHFCTDTAKASPAKTDL
jgi:hypothetical protein